METYKKIISNCRRTIEGLGTNNCVPAHHVWFGNDSVKQKSDIFVCSK